MFKVLIDYGTHQGVVELPKGAKYSGSDAIWDESKDGPLPADVQIGGMVVQMVGGKKSLRLDAPLLAERKTREQEIESKRAKKAERKKRLREINFDSVTPEQMPAVLRDLVDEVLNS